MSTCWPCIHASSRITVEKIVHAKVAKLSIRDFFQPSLYMVELKFMNCTCKKAFYEKFVDRVKLVGYCMHGCIYGPSDMHLFSATTLLVNIQKLQQKHTAQVYNIAEFAKTAGEGNKQLNNFASSKPIHTITTPRIYDKTCCNFSKLHSCGRVKAS